MPRRIEHEICRACFDDTAIIRNTVAGLTGRTALPAVSLGASDARHLRRHRVPAYPYGCAPNNMVKPNEWVDVEDYRHVVQSHALPAAAYLTA